MIRIELLFLVVLDGLRTNNHLAHNLGHDGLSLVGCLLHFLVRNLDGDVEAAQVGDHRDAEGAWWATMTSGTVLIPTVSPPRMRYILYSAGVSKVGP